MARINDIVGPLTSGPSPDDQSVSVATKRSPALRRLPWSGAPVLMYIPASRQMLIGMLALLTDGARMSSPWTMTSPSATYAGPSFRVLVDDAAEPIEHLARLSTAYDADRHRRTFEAEAATG